VNVTRHREFFLFLQVRYWWYCKPGKGQALPGGEHPGPIQIFFKPLGLANSMSFVESNCQCFWKRERFREALLQIPERRSAARQNGQCSGELRDERQRFNASHLG